MARIRTVKLDLWTHEELSSISLEAHVLAAALLNVADDDGYFNANPKLLQSTVFPLRELSGTVPVMLQELSRILYIRLFQGSDGKSYGHICKFKEHQVVNHHKPSKIALLEPSGSDTVVLPSNSVLNGMEGNGREEEGKQPAKSSKQTRTQAKTAESENLESPPDSEELILAIAKAHPDSGSVKGHKVPYLLQQQIISGIVSDSEELELTIEAATQRVLDLTRKYAETKRKFTWGINKFFEHRKYNLDSREWGGPESNFVPADTTKRESILDITERALRS